MENYDKEIFYYAIVSALAVSSLYYCFGVNFAILPILETVIVGTVVGHVFYTYWDLQFDKAKNRLIVLLWQLIFALFYLGYELETMAVLNDVFVRLMLLISLATVFSLRPYQSKR